MVNHLALPGLDHALGKQARGVKPRSKRFNNSVDLDRFLVQDPSDQLGQPRDVLARGPSTNIDLLCIAPKLAGRIPSRSGNSPIPNANMMISAQASRD